MKIKLINPPTDSKYTGRVDKSKITYPIGLEILAKRLELDMEFKPDIEILDGNLLSMKDIMYKLSDSDVVGVTDLFSNHLNALHLLSIAKSYGAKTFMGGTNATNDPVRIKKHFFVDHVLRGNPEDIIADVIEGEDYDKDKIYRSKMNTIFDLSHSDISKYDKEKYFLVPLTKGCEKAVDEGRCTFCSIKDLYNTMAADGAWKQIRVLNSYGFTRFRDTGDNFDSSFYRTFLDLRPDDLSHIQFEVYLSPHLATEENIQLMEDLNINKVFIGVDSYNDNLLRSSNKGFTKEDVDSALERLPEDVHKDIAIMMGFSGETLQTLENNYRFLMETKERYENVDFHISKVLPLVGTTLYKNLIRKGVSQPTDIVDYRDLYLKQLELSTDVSIKDIERYEKKMVPHSFGGFGF
jgi:radical SAM superfamily enzyme YgiQ (UPF0313 family)